MKEKMSKVNNVNLFWTSGWDSTFQLLQLLIIHKQQVTPYYIIHAPRPSTGKEILTMKQIKEQLFKEYPHTQKLLKPTRYYSDNDLLPDQEITKAYKSLLKKTHIGVQYEWLAKFCKEKGINDMQLCAEAPLVPLKNHWGTLLEQATKELKINSQKIYHVDLNHKNKDIVSLIKNFHFPISKITKIQMLDLINNQGLKHIMEMSWFCQQPTCNMKPCGKCKPCRQYIEHGFGWRLPLKSRIVSFIYTIVIIKIKPQLRSILINLRLYKNKTIRVIF